METTKRNNDNNNNEITNHHSSSSYNNNNNSQQQTSTSVPDDDDNHDNNQNIIQLCGTSASKCGYCHGQRASIVGLDVDVASSSSSSVAYGVICCCSSNLCPQTYEELLNRGWRRSGIHLYKPNNWTSCCPAIPIRLSVPTFRISKSQRRTISHFQRALDGTTTDTTTTTTTKSIIGKKKSSTTRNVNPLVLELLESTTRQCLERIVPTVYYQSLVLSSSNNNNNNICQYHIRSITSKKEKKKKQQQQQCRNDTNLTTTTTTIRLICKVCPALEGQSKGVLRRTDIANQLVKELKHELLMYNNNHQSNQNNQSNNDNNNQKTIPIHSISVHEPSGQVVVEVLLSSEHNNNDNDNDTTMAVVVDNDNNDNKDDNDDDTQMSISVTSNNTKSTKRQRQQQQKRNTTTISNPIQQWLSSLSSTTSTTTNNTTANNNNDNNNNTTIPLPPYSLVVTTLSAHDSALYYPDVHQLYFHYQHVIHGDVHPLHEHNDQDEQEHEQTVDWGYAPTDYVHSCQRMLEKEYTNDIVRRNMEYAFCQFYNFLVETPFRYNNVTKLGTVHQHYRIKECNTLLAVGVLDILPHGISSVYAMYDPTLCSYLRHVSMGTYMSLHEIDNCLRMNKQYYYLGYYIESCTKMKYKAQYKPSELLCPTHYQWVDATIGQQLLRTYSPQRHCCTLYNVTTNTNTNNNNKEDDDVDDKMEMTNDDDDDDNDLLEKKRTPNDDQQQQRQRQQQEQDVTEDVIMNRVRLAVGGPSYVTVGTLHDHGQAVVRPLIEDLVEQMGPELATRFVVKLV